MIASQQINGVFVLSIWNEWYVNTMEVQQRCNM